jgi:hypothetical protein
MEDGLPVTLKKVLPDESPHELTMNELFSSQELSSMPDNHCLPMLDTIKLQRSGSQQIMVFPSLLPFHRSQIGTLEEFFVFMAQICEVWPYFAYLYIRV